MKVYVEFYPITSFEQSKYFRTPWKLIKNVLEYRNRSKLITWWNFSYSFILFNKNLALKNRDVLIFDLKCQNWTKVTGGSERKLAFLLLYLRLKTFPITKVAGTTALKFYHFFNQRFKKIFEKLQAKKPTWPRLDFLFKCFQGYLRPLPGK